MQALALIGEFNNWTPGDDHWAQKDDYGVFTLFLPDKADGTTQIAHRCAGPLLHVLIKHSKRSASSDRLPAPSRQPAVPSVGLGPCLPESCTGCSSWQPCRSRWAGVRSVCRARASSQGDPAHALHWLRPRPMAGCAGARSRPAWRPATGSGWSASLPGPSGPPRCASQGLRTLDLVSSALGLVTC